MRSFRTLLGAGLALGLLALAAPAAQGQEIVTVLSSGGDPNQPDLVVPLTSNSPFNLKAKGQEGVVGIRGNGQMTICLHNVGVGMRGAFGCPGAAIQYQRNPEGAFSTGYFDLGLFFAAPPSDMPSTIDPVDSGLRGGGWTVNAVSTIIGGSILGGGDKIWASDRSGTELLALGVQTAEDGSCRDFSAQRDGDLNSPFQLLPVSNCPITHPPSGWQGARPIPEESYLDLYLNDPAFADDPFAFWRVPESHQRTDRFLGDMQSYGEESDFYFEALPLYGAVTPKGSGTPSYHGYPLGLTLKFDVFYFGLPTVGGAVYWQATVVNESEKVYGVGMTYDSLYIGINYDPLMAQQASAQYFDPKRSAMLHNNTGSGCANNPDPPGSGCGVNRAFEGFNAGAAGIIVLKSPLGDLRYKLFSDPTSPFYNPSHPRAGDTIAFNHQHMCGFGGCAPETFSYSQRAFFGLVSSTGHNVLDGRTPDDIGAREYHTVFRSEDWPDRNGQFNKYVPGVHDNSPIWDWNHDGQPDTIYADSCGSRGCVGLWSDTLPSGYTMNYGNISFLSFGPVHMEPGDTIPFVVAFLGAPDSASIEATTNNAIDFYLRFYLGPEAAPAPHIVAANVEGGSTEDAEITLFLDDTSEEWVDPFLSTLDVSADAALNPDLEASIADLVNNNVAAYHVFKSCDGGASFTSDDDCDGDPVSDPTSKWAGFGWQPYRTIEASPDGELPNTFEDDNITAGITYTYSIVTETRGARFNVIRGVPGSLTAETVEFAPALLSALSASNTNPNVAVVYVPVTLAAGARNAEVSVLSRTGASDIPLEIDVVNTAPQGGQFRALIVDSVIVTRTETLAGGEVTEVQTAIEAQLLRTVTGADGSTPERRAIATFNFNRTGTVSTAGLTESPPVTNGDQRVTVSSGERSLIVLASGDQPLLATAVLTGDEATPGSFIGREDFPFFTVSFDEGLGGDFNEEIFLTSSGDTIAQAVAPSVNSRRGGGQTAPTAPSQFGTLELTWQDDAFGPGAPFRIDLRSTVAPAFESSLAGRQAASTSSTDPALLDVIKAADPTVTTTADQLRAFKLPFSIRNLTYNRDAQVVVTRHQETILLGVGNDTLRVNVPADVWVPGDEAYVVETVTRERVDANGNTVLGANGQPETETVPEATFKLVLGCQTPRVSCDPTVGGAASSAYITAREGTQMLLKYYAPVVGGEEVVFEIQQARSATDVVASGERPSLNDVHVVPNPYIFASQYERSNNRVLKFTGLPPQGRIRIYDVAGQFIQQIDYDADDLIGGDLNWNMRTREELELAYGLYIFVLESQGQRKVGKFVIIR